MVNYNEIKHLPPQQGIHPGLVMPVQDEDGVSDRGARKLKLSALLAWLGKAEGGGGGNGDGCQCRNGLRMVGAIAHCTGQDFLEEKAFEWFYSLSSSSHVWDPDAALAALGPDGQPPAGQFNALFWAGAGWQIREYTPELLDIWYNDENQTFWIWISDEWVQLGGGGGTEAGKWLPNETSNPGSTGVEDYAMLSMKQGSQLEIVNGARVCLGGGTVLKSFDGNGAGQNAVSGLQGNITNNEHELKRYGRVYDLDGDIDLTGEMADDVFEAFSVGDEFTFYTACQAHEVKYMLPSDAPRKADANHNYPVKLMLVEKDSTSKKFRFIRLNHMESGGGQAGPPGPPGPPGPAADVFFSPAKLTKARITSTGSGPTTSIPLASNMAVGSLVRDSLGTLGVVTALDGSNAIVATIAMTGSVTTGSGIYQLTSAISNPAVGTIFTQNGGTLLFPGQLVTDANGVLAVCLTCSDAATSGVYTRTFQTLAIPATNTTILVPGKTVGTLHLGSTATGTNTDNSDYYVQSATTLAGVTGFVVPYSFLSGKEVIVIQQHGTANEIPIIFSGIPTNLWQFQYVFHYVSGNTTKQIYMYGGSGTAQATGSISGNDNLRLLYMGSKVRYAVQTNGGEASWTS